MALLEEHDKTSAELHDVKEQLTDMTDLQQRTQLTLDGETVFE